MRCINLFFDLLHFLFSPGFKHFLSFYESFTLVLFEIDRFCFLITGLIVNFFHAFLLLFFFFCLFLFGFKQFYFFFIKFGLLFFLNFHLFCLFPLLVSMGELYLTICTYRSVGSLHALISLWRLSSFNQLVTFHLRESYLRLVEEYGLMDDVWRES